MASIKIDEKIYLLLQNSIRRGHRSMFFVLGEKGTNGIVVLYYLLSKLKSSSKPAVLWCHKTQHRLSLHLNKRLRSLKKKYLNILYLQHIYITVIMETLKPCLEKHLVWQFYKILHLSLQTL